MPTPQNNFSCGVGILPAQKKYREVRYTRCSRCHTAISNSVYYIIVGARHSQSLTEKSGLIAPCPNRCNLRSQKLLYHVRVSSDLYISTAVGAGFTGCLFVSQIIS
jgi:hypothetical protein